MVYETKEGTGTLFKNNNKKKEKHPDMTGKVMIGGVLYNVAAWAKPRKTDPNEKYLFLNLKEFEQKKEDDTPAEPDKNQSNVEDDLPF